MAHVIKPNVAPYSNTAPGVAANFGWLYPLLMLKAGWKYKASAANNVKDVSNDPRNNQFASLTSTASGAAAEIGAKTGYDVLISGLTSMITPSLTNQGGSEGRYIVLTNASNSANNTIYQISQVISSNQVKARPVIVANSAIANDYGSGGSPGSGTINWTEYDPATAAYPSAFPNYPWWMVLRGPSLLKVSFSGFSGTPAYLRGETVTQSATGAEGELIGITYTPAGDGWAVIAPRVAGTGAGAQGWNLTDSIIGSSSTASISPTTILEYVTEVTMGCTNTTFTTRERFSLMLWINPGVALDGGTEEAMLASSIATSPNCTAGVMPGGSGAYPSVTLANNGFPYLGFAPIGYPAGGVNSDCWHHITDYDMNSRNPGNMHACITNCIERSGVSADGTFWAMFGAPFIGASVYHGWGLFRCDDSEEGDMWPYAFYASRRNVYDFNWWNGTYRLGTQGTDNQGEGPWCPLHVAQYIARPAWWTWRARGMEVGGAQTTASTPGIDLFRPIYGTFLINTENDGSAAGIAIGQYMQWPERVAAAAHPTLLREHPVLCSWYPWYKFRKGRTRWLCAAVGNQASDTFGNRSWIQGRDSNPQNTTANGHLSAILLGPWDGSTSPVAY